MWFPWTLCRVGTFPWFGWKSPTNSDHRGNCVLERGLDQSSQASNPKSKPRQGHASHLRKGGRTLRTGFESMLADPVRAGFSHQWPSLFPSPVLGGMFCLWLFLHGPAAWQGKKTRCVWGQTGPEERQPGSRFWSFGSTKTLPAYQCGSIIVPYADKWDDLLPVP